MITTTIRLVIADDHPVVRAGIQGMLNSQPDFEVVAEAENGRQAVSLCQEFCPDVLLLDLRMPDMDGASVIRLLKSHGAPRGILILTTYDTNADILAAIEAGATGYLLKDAPRDEVFRAIRTVARGETAFAPAVARKLRAQTPGKRLSSRELEVLRLVARGANNRDIAQELHLSEATIKSHLIHIFTKLQVDDRTAAVTAAREQGLL